MDEKLPGAAAPTSTPVPEATSPNLNDNVGFNEVVLPRQADAMSDMERAIQQMTPQQTAGGVIQDIWDTNLTGELLKKAYAPRFDPDPNYTFEQFRERLNKASESIPPEFLGAFDNVRSEAEFEATEARVRAHLEALNRLQNTSDWWIVPRIFGTMFDPASLAVGAAAGGVAGAIGGALRAGIMSRVVAANVAGAVAPEVLRDAFSDEDVAWQNYAYALGAGLAFGGTFGYIAKNPATIQEAAKMAASGRLFMAGIGKRKAPDVTLTPKTPEQVDAAVSLWQSVKEREGTLKDGKWYSRSDKLDKELGKQNARDPEFMKQLEDDKKWLQENGLYDAKTPDEVRARIPVEGATPNIPEQTAPILKPAGEYLARELDHAMDTQGPLFKQPQEAAQAAAPESIPVETPLGTVEVPGELARMAGLADEAPVDVPTPGVARQLEQRPEDLTNPRFVSRWQGPDGAEYKVMAETGDMSGPYRVVKVEGKGGKVLAKGLDTLEEAQLAIRGVEATDQIPTGIYAQLAKRTGATVLDNIGEDQPHPSGKILAFHGTAANENFTKLDPQNTRYLGTFFGTTKASNLFADAEQGRVFPAILKMKKPLTLEDQGMWAPQDTIAAIAKATGDDTLASRIAELTKDMKVANERGRMVPSDDAIAVMNRELRAALERGGYDGIRFWNDLEGGWSYIAWNPDTVQSPFNGRDVLARPPEAEPLSQVGAAQAPTVPQWLENVDFRSLTQEDAVGTGVGGWWGWLNRLRYDMAGIGGKAMSPITRLISPHLMNETVGMRDHSRNPMGAILDQRRIQSKFEGEFYRIYRPQWEEYSANTRVRDVLETRRNFNHEVTLYVTGRGDEGAQYHPAVIRTGEALKKIMKEYLEDAKNPLRREGAVGRPVDGAADIEENLNYLMRKIDFDKVREAINTYGIEGVTRTVHNAILRAQPDIDADLARRLAQGWVRGSHSRSVGLGDEWSLAMGEGNRFKLEQLLRNDGQFSDIEIQQVLDRLVPVRGDGATAANMKRRVFLYEGHAEDALPRRDGMGTGRLAMRDLFDNDVERLFMQYNRRMSGHIAMARMQITHPRTGELLVPGITGDADWNRLIKYVKQWYADNAPERAAELGAADEKLLNFARDRILGVPNELELSNPAQWARLIRQYMSMRLMGQVGIAQFGETAHPVAHLGVRATFAHVPAARRIINAAGESHLNSHLFDELEAIGIGVERLHGLRFNSFDEIGDLPFDVVRGRNRNWDRATATASFMEQSVYELSGMSFIQQQQQRAVAAALAQRIANMTRGKIGEGSRRRLAQLGIDEPTLDRIIDQMGKHVDTTDSLFFGKKIRRLNLQKWDDLDARARLEDAIFKAANKFIQTQDPTSSPWFMQGPVGKTIFQFRNFVFTAFNNQLLYNIHMGDLRSLHAFAWTMMWNAVVRGAQVKFAALGRSDAEEYKEKYLSTWELAKAGFERSGWSSILPMGIDTFSRFATGEGMFNARSTGQPSDIFLGSPSVSFFNQAMKGVDGLRGATVGGREMSQAEARALVGLLPYQNLFPFGTALSYMIRDLPEQAPRK